MTQSRYIIVNKSMLRIFNECYIPIPMSHAIEGKSAAMEWMFFRGMQVECKVISEDLFRALNGELPRSVKNG